MITHWWLGLHEDNSSAVRICCRCDSNDPVILTCAGGTQSIVPDTTVDDGNIVFNVTGLTANTGYPFTLSQSNAVSGTAKTAPARGNFAFAVGSCLGLHKPWRHAESLRSMGLEFVSIIGDQMYMSWPSRGMSTSNPGSTTWNGETLNDPSWLRTDLGRAPTLSEYAAVYHPHYRAVFAEQSFMGVSHHIPLIQTSDDHTWPGNDGACNAGLAGVTGLNTHTDNFCLNQDDVDEQWQLGIDAHRAWTKGNPISSDAASRTPLPYPRLGGEQMYYAFTIGRVRFVAPDFCVERHVHHETITDPFTADRNGQANNTVGDWPGGKHMFSEDQWAWIENEFANPGDVDFVVGLFSKSTLGRQDGMYYYDVDRARMLAAMAGCPVATFAITGDVHQPEVWYINTPGSEHLQVNCAPTSNNITPNGDALRTDEIYRPDAPEMGEASFENIVICTVAEGQHIDIRMYDPSMRVRWRGRVLAGSNALVYPETSTILTDDPALDN